MSDRLRAAGILHDPMRWSSLPARLPFAQAPCAVHTHSSGEVPASTELHHLFPLYLQKLARVPEGAEDTERLPLCGSGHSDVHYAIDAILEGRPMPLGVGTKEIAVAREGVARYLKAKGR